MEEREEAGPLHQGRALRLDPRSGKPTATYAVGSPIRSQPVVADGWIYVGTEDGKLVAIDTKDPSITGWPTWGGNAQRTGIATLNVIHRVSAQFLVL